MSRTPSFGPPPRAGTFRPQLEALEDRLAPGDLLSSVDGWAERRDLLAAAQAAGAIRTTAPVVEFLNRGVVRGESTIGRTDNGVTLTLKADNVPAGAYSGWVAIFSPGSTTPVAAGRVAGHVVGQGGHLAFAVHLNEGEVISGHPVFPSGSLQDAEHQEIHFVVRYHGAADPGRIYEQTHTFEPTRAANVLIAIHPAR